MNMPRSLVDQLSPPELADAEGWWAGLSADDRSEFEALCDERLDVCLFGVQAGDGAPIVIGGRFVPRDDAGWHEWHTAYFEYLLEHPELTLEDPHFRRRVMTCTRHQAARSVLATGRIPAGFRCPLGDAGCPMRAILDAAPRAANGWDAHGTAHP